MPVRFHLVTSHPKALIDVCTGMAARIFFFRWNGDTLMPFFFYWSITVTSLALQVSRPLWAKPPSPGMKGQIYGLKELLKKFIQRYRIKHLWISYGTCAVNKAIESLITLSFKRKERVTMSFHRIKQ
jgi:hypothetical protein